jgi:hypothetical protein
LYAALSSIHAELDRRNLSFVYEQHSQSQPIESRLADARPPELPKEISSNFSQAGAWPRTASQAGTKRFTGAALTPAEYVALTNDERAALWALNSGTGHVTCIVEMPGAAGSRREIVLRNVSPEFLQQLARQRQEQDAQLTSRHVESSFLAPEPSPAAAPIPRPWVTE